MLYKNKRNCIERFDDGDAVILDDNTHNTHILNSTALQLYDLCEGKTKAAILECFAELYQDEIAQNPEIYTQIKSDMEEMLCDFIEKGIVYGKENNS